MPAGAHATTSSNLAEASEMVMAGVSHFAFYITGPPSNRPRRRSLPKFDPRYPKMLEPIVTEICVDDYVVESTLRKIILRFVYAKMRTLL